MKKETEKNFNLELQDMPEEEFKVTVTILEIF